jgi:hypothetical protein
MENAALVFSFLLRKRTETLSSPLTISPSSPATAFTAPPSEQGEPATDLPLIGYTDSESSLRFEGTGFFGPVGLFGPVLE